MVFPVGSGNAAAGKKGAAKEGASVALLLDDAVIDVQTENILGTEAEGMKDPGKLFRIGDTEGILAGRFPGRQEIEGDPEGALKQTRQPLGEFRADGKDADLCGGEYAAVGQNAEAFRNGAALLFGLAAASRESICKEDVSSAPVQLTRRFARKPFSANCRAA